MGRNRGRHAGDAISCKELNLSISSLSSYSDLYASNLLNSIASSASNKQNAVQDFQTATQSVDADANGTDPSSTSNTVNSVPHHGHGHHHHAAPTTQNSSDAGNSSTSSSQATTQNSLAQILGTNFDFLGE
jgi:hypothetical protein